MTRWLLMLTEAGGAGRDPGGDGGHQRLLEGGVGCQKSGCHAAFWYSWISPPRTSQRRSRPRFGDSLLRHAPTALASRGPSSGAGAAGCNARRSVAGHEQAAGDDDQQLVQALPADRPDPALNDGVGVGRPHRCADDLGPAPAPHVVERSGEPAVPIADQNPPRHRLITEAGQQIAGLLGHPQAGRMVGDAGKVHRPAAELDDQQHIHPPQQDRVDGEEVTGHDPGGLLAQEQPPTRRGAGSRP
jgi:hypothetical protein